MKKTFTVLALISLAVSCQDSVSFNENFMQGQKDGALWRSKTTTATINTLGELTVTGIFDQEKLVLTAHAASPDSYFFGSDDLNTQAYFYAADGKQFNTLPTLGTPNKILLNFAGAGYTKTNTASTTNISGAGVGLKVSITVDAIGAVTSAQISVPGNGYIAGDKISINKGLLAGDAIFSIVNVNNSNGELSITEYQNGTISGEFKLNAVSQQSVAIAPELVNFQYGKFYKIAVARVP